MSGEHRRGEGTPRSKGGTFAVVLWNFLTPELDGLEHFVNDLGILTLASSCLLKIAT